MAKKRLLRSLVLAFLLPCEVFAASGGFTSNEGWQQGLDFAPFIVDSITTNLGKSLFGPAQGAGQFQTFSPTNPQSFSATIYGNQQTRYELGKVSVCITNFVSAGVNILVKSLAPDNSLIFSHSYDNISGVGSNGVAQCPIGPTTDFNQCLFAGWVFDASSKDLYLSQDPINRQSNYYDTPPHQIINGLMCLSSICGISVSDNTLNAQTILNFFAQGIIQSIKEADSTLMPIGQVDETGLCATYAITSIDKEDENATAISCWNGQNGQFQNCESITKLESRSGNIQSGITGIVSHAEIPQIVGRETTGQFYNDPTTGLVINTPYTLVTHGTTTSSTTEGYIGTCTLANHPFGSEEGFLNHTSTGVTCEENDWTCINQEVINACNQYESNPDCTLIEEYRDNIPTFQFGERKPYNLVRYICWGLYNQNAGGKAATDPVVQTPSWVPPDRTDLHYKQVPLPGDPNPYWITCGNFQNITRKYRCAGNELNKFGLNLDTIASNTKSALDTSTNFNFDETANKLTSFSYHNATTNTMVSKGVDIPFPGASGPEDNCSYSCVVAIYGQDQNIYSDARTRQDIAPCEPGSSPCIPQQAPVGSSMIQWGGMPTENQGSLGQDLPTMVQEKISKEVRPCEYDSDTDTYSCPLKTSDEFVWKDCSCLNLVGEAMSYMGLLKNVAQDITCGDQRPTPSGKVREEVLNKLKENGLISDSKCQVPDSGVPKYVCGWEDTATLQSNAVECQSAKIIRPSFLEPITLRFWASDTYDCMIGWEDNLTGFTMNTGSLVPQSSFFDYCYSALTQDAIDFLTGNPRFNEDDPPIFHYEGGPGAVNISRPVSGYDPRSIMPSYPARTDYVNLYPTSNAPFGWVNMTFRTYRQYDCRVYMGDEGSDDNVSLGERYIGPSLQNNGPIDCDGDGWLDYFACLWRDAGWDCDKDCIADNDYTKCDPIQGWDCTTSDGFESADFPTCVWRDWGYDFDGDGIADYTAPETCSGSNGVDCGYQVDCGTVAGCNGCVDNCVSAPCNCQTCYDICTAANGTQYNCNPHDCLCDTCYTCPGKCYGTEVQAGWDCYGGSQADFLDYNICHEVSGYDCGNNTGTDSNQMPDGHIDNNIHFCAQVYDGWDCNNNPSFVGTNDRIVPGAYCMDLNNLADSECVRGNLLCSRVDFPNDCCLDVEDISFKVDIRNNGSNDYTCNLSYDETDPTPDIEIQEIPYEDPNTPEPEESLALVNGCISQWLNVYFSGTVEGQVFKYVSYEDLIDRIARKRCEWRDYLERCYCLDDPFRTVGNTNFIKVTDKANDVFLSITQ